LFIEDAYKIDRLVDNRLVIETKSVEKISGVHFKQVSTYLKLLKLRNGILMNFNVEWVKDASTEFLITMGFTLFLLSTFIS
jgi:GxxExxY protein